MPDGLDGIQQRMREAIIETLTNRVGPELSTRSLLRDSARTLRERCFARLFRSLYYDGYIQFARDAAQYKIGLPGDYSAQTLLAFTLRNSEATAFLSCLPIMERPTVAGDDYALVAELQDLADLVSWSITEAFRSSYYPAPQNTDPLTDDHIQSIMVGMQRELDRESKSRKKRFPILVELPWNRQVALAERRRWAFSLFGISPTSWKTGKWSLWNVSNNLPPEGPRYEDF